MFLAVVLPVSKRFWSSVFLQFKWLLCTCLPFIFLILHLLLLLPWLSLPFLSYFLSSPSIMSTSKPAFSRSLKFHDPPTFLCPATFKSMCLTWMPCDSQISMQATFGLTICDRHSVFVIPTLGFGQVLLELCWTWHICVLLSWFQIWLTTCSPPWTCWIWEGYVCACTAFWWAVVTLSWSDAFRFAQSVLSAVFSWELLSLGSWLPLCGSFASLGSVGICWLA